MVAFLVNTNRVRLCGTFAGARIDFSPASGGVCEIVWCFGQIGRDEMVTIGAMTTASSGGFPTLCPENVDRENYRPSYLVRRCPRWSIPGY
jgi:hypothetical protein